MSARPCKTFSCDGDGNERLPMFHRTIRMPASLWKAVKRRSARDGKAIRWVVDDALDAELVPLIEELRRLGLRGEVADDKLVRLPMDDNVRGRILFGRRQTGLPAVLCLEDGLSPSAAARVFGLKPATLRKRLHDARARLQRQIVREAESQLRTHLLPKDFAERCVCRCEKAQEAKHRKEVRVMATKKDCRCGCLGNSRRRRKSETKAKRKGGK